MARNGEIIQRQHFGHDGDTICHLRSGYVTTKLHGTSTADATIIRYVQTELYSLFLPSPYASHVNLAAAKHWPFMPKQRDGDSVEFIIFRVYNFVSA